MNVPPSIRKQVVETWQRGGMTRERLADRFDLTTDKVDEILNTTGGSRRFVNHRALQVARGLYQTMPVEIAGQFAQRYEKISGTRSGLLTVPSL